MRFCIAVCGWVLSWIITTPWLNVPCSLFWIRRCNFWSVLQQGACVDCGTLGQEVRKQNAISASKHCAHDLPSWSDLLEFRLCWRWSVPPLHGLLLRFRGFVQHPCLARCGYVYCVRKWKVVACSSNLCSSVSNFGRQFAHNFRNLTLSDTILARTDSEIWGKCRQRDVMVNITFSLIFSSIARIKSSFTTDNRPLHKSSCTFLCPSLNSHTHLHTIELLMACSPIQVTKLTNFSRFHVLHIQEMDYRPHFICGGILYFLKHYKHNTMCWHRSNVCKLCLCLATESTNSAQTCTIMTAALQWQY